MPAPDKYQCLMFEGPAGHYTHVWMVLNTVHRAVCGRRAAVFPGVYFKKSRGQSIVELALILPIAVMILALSADFGRSLTAYIQVGSAAREGAAYAMQSSEQADDIDGIRAAVLAESPTIWGETPQVSSQACTDSGQMPNGTPYQCVAVTVDYDFRPVISIWPIPDSIPMQRTVEMRVVN
jgi:hypothetical protein